MDVTSRTASAVGQTNNIRAELILNDYRKIPVTIADASGQSNENINIVITINRDTTQAGTVVKPPPMEKRPPSVQSGEDISLLEKEQESIAVAGLKLIKFDEKLNAFNDVIESEFRRSSRIAENFQNAKKTTSTGAMTITYLDKIYIDSKQVAEITAAPKVEESVKRTASLPDITYDVTKLFREGDSKNAMNDSTKLELAACQKLLVIPSSSVLPTIAPTFLPTVVFLEAVFEAPAPKIPEEKPRAVTQAKAQTTTITPPSNDDFQAMGKKDSMNNATKCDFGQSRKLVVISSQSSLTRIAARECPTVAYVYGQGVEAVKPKAEEAVLVQRTVATNLGVKSSSSSKTNKKETKSRKSVKDKRPSRKASKSSKFSSSATTVKAVSADPVDVIGLDIPSVLNDELPPVEKVEQSPVEVEKKPLSPETHRVVKAAESRKRKTLFTTLSAPPPAAKTTVGDGRQVIASKSTISSLVEETNVGSNAVENRAEIEISNIAPGTKVAVDMVAKQAAPDNECSTSFFMSSAKEGQKTETKSAVLKDRKAGKNGREEKPKKQSKQGKVKKSEKKKKKKN